MGRTASAGCLGVLLLAGVLVVVALAWAPSLVLFPPPTPLPRLGGDATDAFSIRAGETVVVRRLTVDVPGSALPIELGTPIPVHVEVDVTASNAASLALAVVDGNGADVVRQRQASSGADVRWEVACALREPCHRTFDVAFSRDRADADLEVRWRVKGELRYPEGGLVPADAGLALTVASGPEVADPRQPVLGAALEPQLVRLSAAEPHAIRVATVELRGADVLPESALAGLRGLIRTELVAVPEATPRPSTGDRVVVPIRGPPPVEILVWPSGDEVSRLTRTVAPGESETDQLDLGATCAPAASSCEVDLVVMLRLLSDGSSGAYEVEVGIEAQLLAGVGDADGAELAVAERPVPELVVILEETAHHELTLTRQGRFAGQVRLSALLSPAPLTPELPQLPVLSSAQVRASAAVGGSTRRPPVQLVVTTRSDTPPAVRAFRPGGVATVRTVGFDGCDLDRPCHLGASIDLGVIGVAGEMTSEETVTVTLEATVTVLGFASGAPLGSSLTVELQ